LAGEARKEVRVSVKFDLDIIAVFEYGEEIFGYAAASTFVYEIFDRISKLDEQYFLHPECRHLPTKNHRYRNIILASYLIIYRVNKDSVEVLRILHGRSSIRKIKSVRSVKIPTEKKQ
jgi:plasmid stabilization system protein ParE